MKSRAPKSSNQTFKHCILFKHRSSLKEQTLCPKGQFLTVDYELQIGQSRIIFDKIFRPLQSQFDQFPFCKMRRGGIGGTAQCIAVQNNSSSKIGSQLIITEKRWIKFCWRDDTRSKRIWKTENPRRLVPSHFDWWPWLLPQLIHNCFAIHIYTRSLGPFWGPTSSWRLRPSLPSSVQAVWPTQVTTNQSSYILCGQSCQSWWGGSLGFRVLPDNLF